MFPRIGFPSPRTSTSSMRMAWAGITFFAAAFTNLLGAVVINEIHYQPANKTKLEEFIELHNPGAAAVDVSGWRMEDGGWH